jgi:hypothetical protein
MEKPEQKAIVKSILQGTEEALSKAIDGNRVPDTWNGFELRQWVSDYIAANYVDKFALKAQRKRDYISVIVNNNLT